MLRGGGCPCSTRRWRKTTTWERGAREDAARKGHFCRTCRVGEQEPTSLRRIATRGVCLVTEASPTEEPCEGKLHAGICAGGAGRPAFLPRRRSFANAERNTIHILGEKTLTDYACSPSMADYVAAPVPYHTSTGDSAPAATRVAARRHPVSPSSSHLPSRDRGDDAARQPPDRPAQDPLSGV